MYFRSFWRSATAPEKYLQGVLLPHHTPVLVLISYTETCQQQTIY